MSRRRRYFEDVEDPDAWQTFDDIDALDRDLDDYEASHLGWRRDEL